MGQVGSQRAYARHRGCTHRAVQKAIEAGRIPVLPDGRVDFDAADAAWTANTRDAAVDLALRRLDRHGAGPPRHRGRTPRTLVEAQRRLVLHKGTLAKLAVAEMRGGLVNVEQARKAMFALARGARDRMLAIPGRIAHDLAAEMDPEAVRRRLDAEIGEALDELSEPRIGLPLKVRKRPVRTPKSPLEPEVTT